jgi:hypothetical protein
MTEVSFAVHRPNCELGTGLRALSPGSEFNISVRT